MTTGPRIILASASPAKAEVLRHAGISFKVIPSNFDEDLTQKITHDELVQQLALGKAQTVAKDNDDAIVIGADTMVVIDDQRIGKPRDETEAREMLVCLRGREHQVLTGMAVIANGQEQTRVAKNRVWFRDFSNNELSAYAASGEPMGKAGAYGIQGRAGLFVERIDGDFYGVVGLSLAALAALFTELGISDQLLNT